MPPFVKGDLFDGFSICGFKGAKRHALERVAIDAPLAAWHGGTEVDLQSLTTR